MLSTLVTQPWHNCNETYSLWLQEVYSSHWHLEVEGPLKVRERWSRGSKFSTRPAEPCSTEEMGWDSEGPRLRPRHPQSLSAPPWAGSRWPGKTLSTESDSHSCHLLSSLQLKDQKQKAHCREDPGKMSSECLTEPGHFIAIVPIHHGCTCLYVYIQTTSLCYWDKNLGLLQKIGVVVWMCLIDAFTARRC